MGLHDSFHSVNSFVSDCICILSLVRQECAAALLDALLITSHTSSIGCVTLNACNFDAVDFRPTSFLGELYSSLCAGLSSCLVTSTYERNNFRCINVGIDCNNRGGLTRNQVCNQVRL